jgi:hypothetical protein
MLELSVLEQGCEAVLATRAFVPLELDRIKILRIDWISPHFDDDAAVGAGYDVLIGGLGAGGCAGCGEYPQGQDREDIWQLLD